MYIHVSTPATLAWLEQSDLASNPSRNNNNIDPRLTETHAFSSSSLYDYTLLVLGTVLYVCPYTWLISFLLLKIKKEPDHHPVNMCMCIMYVRINKCAPITPLCYFDLSTQRQTTGREKKPRDQIRSYSSHSVSKS